MTDRAVPYVEDACSSECSEPPCEHATHSGRVAGRPVDTVELTGEAL